MTKKKIQASERATRERDEQERKWKCESALLILVASQLTAEAARILIASPQRTEDSFVAQARVAFRQAVAERDAQVERFRNVAETKGKR